MKLVEEIPHASTGLFNKLFLDYISDSDRLESYYHFKPNWDGIGKSIAEKKSQNYNRLVLHNVLSEQNEKYFSRFSLLRDQINIVKEINTFFVTTGHQLCFASGPLYTIYKICDVITLSQQIKKQFPDCNFIPLFWMASEDHDLEEINHIHLFGNKFSWNNTDASLSGRLSLNTIAPILSELKDFFKNSKDWSATLHELDSIYNSSSHQNYADATRAFLYHLFGHYGLLILDPDSDELKSQFAPVVKKEFIEKQTLQNIQIANKRLEADGYHIQAKAKTINSFYIKDQKRIAIEYNEETQKFLIDSIEYTLDEIIDEVDKYPGRFSPNVFFRPLYQELLLPNISYSGGPGEIAYWLQMKEMFEYYGVKMPALIPRSNYMIIDSKMQQFFSDHSILYAYLFKSTDELIRLLISNKEGEALGLSDTLKQELYNVYDAILKESESIDKGLIPYIESEKAKAIKFLSNLDSKIIRSKKRVYDESVQKIKNYHNKLFPDGIPQERYENILAYYKNCEDSFIENILQINNPLKFQFKIVVSN
ncbi:MAG TPA: bacillithiol biosynthesis cysteine-adding enzyme BshC [Bacteroidia bacterium]|nr:bacillithiol biosynthesis cysteine-adding enzyme BshC [Bacteroidia bacterium]HNT80329.1 bacillithiol biosynthesis cysteine-adding enzyme BshC [Bacteroidia bacterium]